MPDFPGGLTIAGHGIANADIDASAGIVSSKFARTQTETVLASDLDLYSQGIQPILSGSFVPKGTAGYLTTPITAQVLGMAFAAFKMYYGTPATPLYRMHQEDSITAGVTEYRLGDIGPESGPASTSRRKLITGLTPSATYNWQLQLAITGGAAQVTPVGNNPFGMVVTPDGRRLFVANNNDGTVHVVNLGGNQGNSALNGLSYLSSYAGLVTVGAGPQGLAITPDGTKVVCCNTTARTVTVINTSDLSVQGTYTMPGTAPLPARAVCTSNTRAYITDYQNAKVHSLEILTGTWGSAPGFTSAGVTVGTNPTGICVLPNGTKLYIANQGSNNVSVITVSSGAVAATVTLTNATNAPFDCAAMPDGSAVWVTTFGGTSGVIAQQVVTSTDTIGVSSESIAGGNPGAQGIAIDLDGNTAWIVGNNGKAYQMWVSPNSGYIGKCYLRGVTGISTNLNDIVMDKAGFIYISDKTNNRLWCYPGSHVICYGGTSANALFANESCAVVWEDA